jgi:hypothetical protein
MARANFLAIQLWFATEPAKPRCVRFGGILHRFGHNGDVVMARIRTTILAAGAAALLSSQAVYAAPSAPVRSVDPLVSLSALGSVASRTAVCAGSTAAVAAASAAVQTATPGCVLPVTAPPPPAPVTAAVAPVVPGPEPKSIGWLPILLGAAALAGLIALILSSDDNGHGDNTPVSPA